MFGLAWWHNIKSTGLDYPVINVLKPDSAPNSFLNFREFTTVGELSLSL